MMIISMMMMIIISMMMMMLTNKLSMSLPVICKNDIEIECLLLDDLLDLIREDMADADKGVN